MKLIMHFSKEDGIIELPLDYNHILQSFIYRHISNQRYREFLHECGYAYENRKYKAFTFSRIESTYTINREKNKICFKSPVKWTITAIAEEFISDLMTTILKQDNLHWLDQKIQLDSFQIEPIPDVSSPTLIRTLSPITMYTTFLDDNRRKKTHYYHCEDPAFSSLIKNNLIKKYIAILKNKPENTDFSIKPIYIKKRTEIIRFKKFIIKGWLGIFECKGSPELIKFALKVGLGGKSSQGFGCVEVWKGGEKS